MWDTEWQRERRENEAEIVGGGVDRGPEGPDIHSTDSDRYHFEVSSSSR